LRVLMSVRLRPWHVPTGRTTHIRNGSELPVPVQLQIAEFDDDPGFYLLYLNEIGEELTDTYHDSVEQALSQAALEFGVVESQWSRS